MYHEMYLTHFTLQHIIIIATLLHMYVYTPIATYHCRICICIHRMLLIITSTLGLTVTRYWVLHQETSSSQETSFCNKILVPHVHVALSM